MISVVSFICYEIDFPISVQNKGGRAGARAQRIINYMYVPIPVRSLKEKT